MIKSKISDEEYLMVNMRYGLDIENHPTTPLGQTRSEGVGLTVKDLAKNFSVSESEVNKRMRNIHKNLWFHLQGRQI